MKIEELRAVVARAATSDERHSDPQFQIPVAYRYRAGSGKVDDAAPFRAAQVSPSGSSFPNWARRLRSILTAVRQDAPAAMAVAEPLPFDGLFLPVVARAQHQLRRMTGTRYHELLRPQAQSDLGRSLLKRLSEVAGAFLLREFNLFRHFARSRPSFIAGSGHDNGGALYDEFIAEMRVRLPALILENPVLGRMIGTVVDNWLRATSELIRALADDGAMLADMFAKQPELGPVEAITCDMSDPHRGGRTVAILHFACRTTLVYKPKTLRLDQRWGEFLNELRAAGAPLDLQSVRVLARERHGWAEMVASETPVDAGSTAAPTSYYRRAGALLALLYILQARDIHSGNVVRRGDQPILIDLETLFHSTPVYTLRDWPSDHATATALELLSDSVAATLYLPLWVLAPTGELLALGGLSGVPPAVAEAPAFLDVNTDAMRLAGTATSEIDHARTPGDATLARPENQQALCAGFAEVYRFFQDNGHILAAHDGPIVRCFAGVTIRAVFKPTTDYIRKLRLAMRKVDLLGNGTDWSAQFGDRHETAISAAERRSLAKLDVPFFTTATDSLGVDADAEAIAGCFTATPLSQVLARVKTLSAADLDFQLALITTSIRLGESAPGPVWPQSPDDRAASLANYPTRAIAACSAIAGTLARSAIRSGDGAAWLGIVPVDHDHEAVSVIGTDLYSGSVGVALFLAAFAKIADDRAARELALAATASLIRICDSAGALARMPIGGGFGIASTIYGLVQLADLLGRPELLDHAIGLSREISAERIAADRSYDSLRGAGGAILGLLALHRLRPEPDVLQRAIHCGDHVMTAPPAIRDDIGTAFALARLAQASGEPRFRDAAVAAWRGTPSLAPPAEPWCRGLVGYGLAAIGLSRSGIVPDLQPDLKRMIATAAGAAAFDDSLCCGRSGGIELLIEAGGYLGRPDLVTIARRTAVRHLLAADGAVEQRFRPGLFRGLSGVGYTLLRTLHPELLPCPLLWDGPRIQLA